MKMKKVVAVVVSLIFALSLVACGGKDNAKETKSPENKQSEAPASVAPAGSATAESAAPAQSAAAATGKKIGLVQINNTNSYYIGASKAFNEAAQHFGYTLDEQFAENSLEKEISIIENFIQLKYDVIIADPQDAEALEDVFQKGKDAGIKMVALRSPMKNADYNCIISHYDGFYGATIAGCELIGGKGKVLLLEGQIGHEASDSRTKAFKDVLKKYPDIEVECLENMKEGLIDVEAFFGSTRDGYNCMAYVDAILRGVNVEKTVYLPLYTACSKELQDKVKAVDSKVNVCSPEEALDKSANYDKEFLGLYDK